MSSRKNTSASVSTRRDSTTIQMLLAFGKPALILITQKLKAYLYEEKLPVKSENIFSMIMSSGVMKSFFHEIVHFKIGLICFFKTLNKMYTS